MYLSVAPELEAVTGRYYDVLTETEPAPQALDPDAARRLWDASSSLLGLEAGPPRQTAPGPAPGPTETGGAGVVVD